MWNMKVNHGPQQWRKVVSLIWNWDPFFYYCGLARLSSYKIESLVVASLFAKYDIAFIHMTHKTNKWLEQLLMKLKSMNHVFPVIRYPPRGNLFGDLHSSRSLQSWLHSLDKKSIEKFKFDFVFSVKITLKAIWVDKETGQTAISGLSGNMDFC